MAKQFRALRVLIVVYRALAWIILGGGMLFAILAVTIGLVQGRAGAPSPLLSAVPVLSQIDDLATGLLVSVGVLILALVHFVLAYAAAEVIELGLAIERHTRDTAYYLRGEGELPASPQPIPWDAPLASPDEG